METTEKIIAGLRKITWAAAVAQDRVEELFLVIKRIQEYAYKAEVIDTEMEDLIIGDGKEYADKQDWMDTWLDQFESD